MTLARQYRNPFAIKETPRWLIEQRIRSGKEPYPHLARQPTETEMSDELKAKLREPQVYVDRLRSASVRLVRAANDVTGHADIPESALAELNAASVAVDLLLAEAP